MGVQPQDACAEHAASRLARHTGLRHLRRPLVRRFFAVGGLAFAAWLVSGMASAYAEDGGTSVSSPSPHKTDSDPARIADRLRNGLNMPAKETTEEDGRGGQSPTSVVSDLSKLADPVTESPASVTVERGATAPEGSSAPEEPGEGGERACRTASDDEAGGRTAKSDCSDPSTTVEGSPDGSPLRYLSDGLTHVLRHSTHTVVGVLGPVTDLLDPSTLTSGHLIERIGAGDGDVPVGDLSTPSRQGSGQGDVPAEWSGVPSETGRTGTAVTDPAGTGGRHAPEAEHTAKETSRVSPIMDRGYDVRATDGHYGAGQVTLKSSTPHYPDFPDDPMPVNAPLAGTSGSTAGGQAKTGGSYAVKLEDAPNIAVSSLYVPTWGTVPGFVLCAVDEPSFSPD